jgi:hypothetical protein
MHRCRDLRLARPGLLNSARERLIAELREDAFVIGEAVLTRPQSRVRRGQQAILCPPETDEACPQRPDREG